jgi:hypothetical protein
MEPEVWISVVMLLVGYFVCLSESLVETNTSVTDRSNIRIRPVNHSNDSSERLGASPYWQSMDDVMANSLSDHEVEYHGIHVANWRWEEIGVFFTFAVFIVVSGLAKVGKLL